MKRDAAQCAPLRVAYCAYNILIRGIGRGAVSSVTAHTSASSRSGEVLSESPLSPKSHI